MSKAKIKFLKRLDKNFCVHCAKVSSSNPGRHRVDINSVLNASRLFSGMNTFFLDEQIANGVEFPSLNFPVYCFTDLKFCITFQLHIYCSAKR